MASAYSKEQLLTMYRKMYLLRRFEERAGQQYGLGKIAGFCHLYIGQEAVAVGANEAIRSDDYMLSAYRDHGQPLARGSDAGMVMAELFGRGTGYSKGKGGSMHIFDIEHHFYGGYGIVGGQIPLAAGMAFASRYRNEDRVTVCFFGDAAANQGAFHETLNMAAKWKLPVIYICENNRYGMGTAIARTSAVPEIHKRASAYGIRGAAVDGMDVLKMYDAVKDAAAYCRAGNGPVLLEANTYRFRGHSMADPANYRTKQEVEDERKNDPLPKLRAYILAQKLATDADFEAIEDAEKAVVDAAVKFADESPEPSLDELWRDTIVEPGEEDVRPRERVLGVKVTQWPSYPSGQELKVTWDLEPREQAEQADRKAGLIR
ncbi:pyruvate dehydrogenase (acetyl-transferring) E1 component subunit alpha [Corallococcus sp. M34]|uniref:pyruvate dehydrogenase (acetyl-transferring) E1 component subunit alpha n=1 Tax=Citreicoccus inhibens TaxID=2849499 RepID=UPI001C22747A|nr:pyruvate dehydrogenase (acetyl-transferring) E1 component subunit alpha [Citreicoccus inhibens]MBU8898235.1 pyruvate dehydrogenase (acetyl-transferring) E1 component subunit alpha [Citreicoccus inhibens]